MTAQRRTLTITCSSCGQAWEHGHQCSVPPPIDFTRYSTGALERLAADLALVLQGRHAP